MSLTCPVCSEEIEPTDEHPLEWMDSDIVCPDCGTVLQVEAEESWDGSTFWLVVQNPAAV